MNKVLKIVFIVLTMMILFIIFDTLQAKIFDNSPIIKVTENYNSANVLKREKGIFIYTYVFTKGEKVTVYRWEKYAPPLNYNDEIKSEEEAEMETIQNINVIINGTKYSATIEDNRTVKEFLKLLPQEFNMQELNGNEKYTYIDYSLPTNAANPKHIIAGDIMLYGNNCLVIFYKSFDTNYSYTKLGHINNLPNLGNDDITVTFEK